MRHYFILLLMLCVDVTGAHAQVWTLHRSYPEMEFSDVKFLNNDEGFVVGDSALNGIFITTVIFKTVDGGQSWASYNLGNPNQRITKSYFLNSSEGFAAGRNGGGNNGLFLKTIDGGMTWTNQTNFNEKLFNVCFLDSLQGWVMGKNGLLSKTVDGGVNWTAVNLTNEDIHSMRFFNSQQGVMACGGGEIYITSNGGMNWSSISSNVVEDLMSIDVYNSSAWICGTAGTLLFSSDTAQSWTSQTAAINIDFNDISFGDSLHGWTGGLAGLMNQTIDGGGLWQNQQSNSAFEITGISIPSADQGWFCTANGELYAFGGVTNILETNIQKRYISAYPNPATNVVSIPLHPSSSEVNRINIYNLQGNLSLVIQDPETIRTGSISLQELLPGMYFLEVISGVEIAYSKFIKSN
ncbi:MAG: T9SS type A sorting domain-containing protein [Bacteroidetes bacterium]|nr:T9SS type A sorting domain-containing protein [Bacteroidota bacterium]